MPSGNRGNPTTIKTYTASGTHLDETIAYDDLGNVLSRTDSLGHTTSFVNTDNFASGTGAPTYMRGFAHPTTITDPASNAV